MAMLTIFSTTMKGKPYTEIDADPDLSVGEGLVLLGNAMILLLQSIPNKRDRMKAVRALFKDIRKAVRRLNRIG